MYYICILLFCEQFTCLCLRSNWPRLSHPPVYRNVYCWLSCWKNRSSPLWHFWYYLFSIPVQSHHLILIEFTITLTNNNQKDHFESGLDPVGCWSQLFKNLLAFLVSKTSGLFKDKDKDYHRLWKHCDQVRQRNEKYALHIIENVILIVIFTSKNDFSKRASSSR